MSKYVGLSEKEQREWKSLQAKSKRYHISVKRVGNFNSNVVFPDGVYAQLGTGHATEIMDARIKVNALRKKAGYPSSIFK